MKYCLGHITHGSPPDQSQCVITNGIPIYIVMGWLPRQIWVYIQHSHEILGPAYIKTLALLWNSHENSKFAYKIHLSIWIRSLERKITNPRLDVHRARPNNGINWSGLSRPRPDPQINWCHKLYTARMAETELRRRKEKPKRQRKWRPDASV